MTVPWIAIVTLAHLLGDGQQADRPAPTAAQMQRAKDIYLPSAPHEVLATLAGEWEQTADYASGHGTVRAVGRVRNRMTLGNRFLVSEGEAKGSIDVTSMLVFGFDGRSREHTVVVFDSFGTYYVTANGPAQPDAAGRLVLRGETREGAGTKKFDVVLQIIDANAYATEIVFHLPGREPTVAVSTRYRRLTAP